MIVWVARAFSDVHTNERSSEIKGKREKKKTTRKKNYSNSTNNNNNKNHDDKRKEQKSRHSKHLLVSIEAAIQLFEEYSLFLQLPFSV